MTSSSLEALLSDLEAKAGAATPGPWEFSSSLDKRRGAITCPKQKISPLAEYDPEDGYATGRADSYAFIASCNPETVKRLIAIIRRQREAIEYMSDDLCPHTEAFKELDEKPQMKRAFCVCSSWVYRWQSIDPVGECRADVEKIAKGEP